MRRVSVSARQEPRWSTMLLLGLVLLVVGGLLGVLCAIGLLIARGRARGRVAFTEMLRVDDPIGLRRLLASGQQGASVAALIVGVDAIALLVSRYTGVVGAAATEAAFFGQSDTVLSIALDDSLFRGGGFLIAALVFMAIGGRYSRRLSETDTNLLAARAALGAGILEIVWCAWAGQQVLLSVALSWVFALCLLPMATSSTMGLLASLGLQEHVMLMAGDPAAVASISETVDARSGRAVAWYACPPNEVKGCLGELIAPLSINERQRLQVVLCRSAETMVSAIQDCRDIEALGVACSTGVELGPDGRDGLDEEVELIDGVLIVHGALRRVRPVSIILKRLVDIFGALVGLIFFSPVMLFLAAIVKLDSGPVVFAHERVGRRGRRFKCLKIRSMRTDAEEVLQALFEADPGVRSQWEKDFKLKDDPRITPIGAFMRRTSLDELPQFWNVLRGDMSLVGPRPIVERELHLYYGRAAAGYMSVKPGITGLWQISGRNDLSYEDRVSLDAEYGRTWSVAADFMIMIRTLEIMVYGRGAY